MKKLTILAVFVGLLFVTGCGQEDKPVQETQETTVSKEPEISPYYEDIISGYLRTIEGYKETIEGYKDFIAEQEVELKEYSQKVADLELEIEKLK